MRSRSRMTPTAVATSREREKRQANQIIVDQEIMEARIDVVRFPFVCCQQKTSFAFSSIELNFFF